MKTRDTKYKLSDFDTQKKEILEEVKSVKYNDLEDLVHRFQLTYAEFRDILDSKYNPTKKDYSLNPGVYEMNDINKTLIFILPDNAKISNTFNDNRLKSNINNNQTSFFTEKSLFYTIRGFTQSHFYPLNDMDGFYQMIAGSFQSNRPINITGIDKILLKANCIKGSFVNSVREPILYSFAISSPPGRKIYKEPRIKLYKKIYKSVQSHTILSNEDDHHKPFDFNGKTMFYLSTN